MQIAGLRKRSAGPAISANSTAQMRIAYLALEAPRDGQASYAHVNEIVSGLRGLGFAVDLIKPSYTDRWSTPGLMRRLVEFTWLQARLLRFWRSYDLIYVRGHFMALPIALAAYLTNRPIIQEVNGPYRDLIVTYRWALPLSRLLRWSQRVQNRWATAVVAVTPQLRRWLQAEGCVSPVEVIPNAVNLAYFNPDLVPRPGLPKRYVVFFGWFARWQGIEIMIEAVRHGAWPSGIALVFIGDGQMRSIVEKAAASHELIVYLGRLPHRELGAAVVGAIAGLVPKLRQNDPDETGLYPLKLFEVLACGVPAIVSDYPGQADLVRDAKCGVVVKPGDPGALARAVAALSDDLRESRSMGQRGFQTVAASHSWDCRAKQTAELVRQVTGGRAGRER